MFNLLRVACIGLALAGLLAPTPAAADGSWLDTRPLTNWNSAGMSLPTAPPQATVVLNPACQDAVTRPAETDPDSAVAAAGWMLFGSYTGGWGVVVVKGASSFDGMCRPLGYNEFVFVDGTFAGTLSPLPMDSRADGAGQLTGLENANLLTAIFARYKSGDAACCPSSTTPLRYSIDRTGAAPVLVPQAG